MTGVWSPSLTSVVTRRQRLDLTPFRRRMRKKKQRRRMLGNNMEKIINWPGGSAEAGRRKTGNTLAGAKQGSRMV